MAMIPKARVSQIYDPKPQVCGYSSCRRGGKDKTSILIGEYGPDKQRVCHSCIQFFPTAASFIKLGALKDPLVQSALLAEAYVRAMSPQRGFLPDEREDVASEALVQIVKELGGTEYSPIKLNLKIANLKNELKHMEGIINSGIALQTHPDWKDLCEKYKSTTPKVVLQKLRSKIASKKEQLKYYKTDHIRLVYDRLDNIIRNLSREGLTKEGLPKLKERRRKRASNDSLDDRGLEKEGQSSELGHNPQDPEGKDYLGLSVAEGKSATPQTPAEGKAALRQKFYELARQCCSKLQDPEMSLLMFETFLKHFKGTGICISKASKMAEEELEAEGWTGVKEGTIRSKISVLLKNAQRHIDHGANPCEGCQKLGIDSDFWEKFKESRFQ